MKGIVGLALSAVMLVALTARPSASQQVATVAGQITSGGKPVTRAIVVADPYGKALAAMTDPEGRFKITGVPTGHHDVFSFADGGYIYDHGGFPDLKAGENDHSRNLVHLSDTSLAPTVDHIVWSATQAKPGQTLTVTADWKAHDKVGISDEIFVFVPQFGHVARFGIGLTHRGKNPDGRYQARLVIPSDAKPGTYTAYVFGASETCYTNAHWPTQQIVIR